MQPSRRVILATLILFLSHPEAYALKIEDTDFGSILGPNASILHPIFGLALYLRGQKMLINLYQHGNPEHPLIKIIHTLFHHDTEGEMLRPSASEASVAYGFGPYEVGWLLALIVCRPELFSDPNLYQTQKTNKKFKMDKELEQFIHTVDLTHKKRVVLEHPNRKKRDVRGTSVKKLLDFSLNAIKALQYSSDQVYDAEFVPLIFNMFACSKSKNRQDVFDFVVNGFIKHAIQSEKKTKKTKKTDYMTPLGNQILKKPNLEKEFIKKKSPLQNIRKVIEAYFATMVLENRLPSKLLFPGTAHLLGLNPETTPITMQHITKYENAPDCTEAALLHLVTQMLFNHQKGFFDETTLPQTLQKQKDLVFTLGIVDTDEPNNLGIRTAWFEFLSNRSGIAYKQPGCSVCARAKNIFILLNQIFSVDTKSWADLSHALSSPRAKIVLTGPDLINELQESAIILKKIYPDGSTYKCIIGIRRDAHAAIMDAQFKQTVSDEPSQNTLFANMLVPIGLPPAVYGAIVPLTRDEWNMKVIPKKVFDAKKLFLTLSKNLESSSYLEFAQLAYVYPKLKELISPVNLKPEGSIALKDVNAWWLLTSNNYKKPIYWNAIINSAEIFIEQAFFQKKYAAIHYLLDVILGAMTIPGSPDEHRILKTVWLELLEEHKSLPPERSFYPQPAMIYQKAAIHYRHNPAELNNIMKKLIQRGPDVLPYHTKKIIARDIETYGPFARKFIEYDNTQTATGTKFSYIKPHMLYVLLETAITDADIKNRSDCLKFLMGNQHYLEENIYREHTITSLCAQKHNGITIARTTGELDRTAVIGNKLVANYKKQAQDARKWAVVPYGQK